MPGALVAESRDLGGKCADLNTLDVGKVMLEELPGSSRQIGYFM